MGGFRVIAFAGPRSSTGLGCRLGERWGLGPLLGLWGLGPLRDAQNGVTRLEQTVPGVQCGPCQTG